ncbi:MOSC domain-containing protein [Pseudorhodoferax sp. Leaf267]|uniref:MOSC domain-containing protein n=1 Tax=Pseudorhodoferax sp. Leaf267 TaxID=1736316 RepID=UPI0009E8F9D2|nr:MOSC domain-containing protein [Pseudorhodoferax sp. Leaf267]
MQSIVVSVSLSNSHSFSKTRAEEIMLLEGLGVQGDAHNGVTVKHRSRVAQDPTHPNLRQVHLIHAELLHELAAKGFSVEAGQIGENITTSGLDLLGLPVDTELHIGATAIVRITGLRNPCVQLDQFKPGLMSAVLGRTAEGALVRKAGIMGVVATGGIVRLGDSIRVQLPPEPHRSLERV